MGDEAGHDAANIDFVIAVRDRTHLDTALRNLRRTPSVLKADRARVSKQVSPDRTWDSER
jgi:GTP pyrophosphokinase